MALKKGTVYLVGAGPGDYQLITLLGLHCIREADVIVYDRLVNPILLNYARRDAELIYVGKSLGSHAMRQDEINAILVQKATEGKNVVRLKGGDPFVFGRGGEEAEFLLHNKVSFEVVPGVCSAIAVPAYAGIPITHRSIASSFAVVTGHEAEGKDNGGSIKWDKLATACDTLIFLMGVGNLPSIVGNLLKYGRDQSEPVALIQWGTTPEQRCLIGDLSNIVEKAAQANPAFAPPAIVVVGKVASFGEKLAWFGKKPLFGKRIVITRPHHQAKALAELIADLGGEPWEFPTIEIALPSDFLPLDQAISQIDEYSWLVFTSANGVSAFFERMKHLRKDIRILKDVNISAIGPKTRLELERRGLTVDYVPENYTSQALVDGLRSILNKSRIQHQVLIPRAESAPDAFGILQDMGFHVDEVPAYKTIQGSGDVQLTRQLFQERKMHILTFTSSSAVANFANMMMEEVDNLQELLEGVTVACIGPATARAAGDIGIPVHVIAEEHTVEGMIASILAYTGQEFKGSRVQGFKSSRVQGFIREMHHFFPVNLNLQGRKCLVVGGGHVAERKVKSLLQCGAEVWVVSPELTQELEKLGGEGAINVANCHYTVEALRECFLVISAADDPAINSKVADDCSVRGILVNVVDDPDRCSFTVPSVLRRGSLCITVSTEGKSPLLAKKIRVELENLFGPEYSEFLELMSEVRSRVMRDIPDAETRYKIFECVINSDILKLIKKKTESPESQTLRSLIEERIMQCMRR